jgi:hypothetical protein
MAARLSSPELMSGASLSGGFQAAFIWPVLGGHRGDWMLTNVTGCDPSITDYVLEVPVKCPRCAADINEKRLVVNSHELSTT